MKNIKNSVCDRIRLLSDKVKYECENITLLLSSLQGDVFGQTELRERKAYALYLKARESVKLISDEAFYASEYFSSIKEELYRKAEDFYARRDVKNAICAEDMIQVISDMRSVCTDICQSVISQYSSELMEEFSAESDEKYVCLNVNRLNGCTRDFSMRISAMIQKLEDIAGFDNQSTNT